MDRSVREWGRPEVVALPEMDYAALFAATPSPYLVLVPDLVIVEVNQAYLDATGRTRAELLGKHIFEAFPDNPADPEADGVRNLSASLHRVLALRKPDTMALQKYDIPVMDEPGAFEERWWSPINTPILAPGGSVQWIIHRVEDVTAFVQARVAGNQPPVQQLTKRDALEAELYARARELQRLNEELRLAHTRERQVAHALAAGMTNKEIAERLYVSVTTVNFHVRNILAKLGMRSRRELRALALPRRRPVRSDRPVKN